MEWSVQLSDRVYDCEPFFTSEIPGLELGVSIWIVNQDKLGAVEEIMGDNGG